MALIAPPYDFTITMLVSPESAEGQRLLIARAREICGPRFAHLIRYRFVGEEALTGAEAPPPRFEVRQELDCLDEPPPAPSGEPAPAGWQPAPADERRVLDLTRLYFALVDSGSAAEVHRLWSADNQAMTPVEERAAELAAFRREAGAPGGHRIAALTWYVNPDNAPRPGIYVAADYERVYAGLHLHCGYLMWFREADDRYVLIREESSLLSRSQAGVTPESLAEIRRALRCPAS